MGLIAQTATALAADLDLDGLDDAYEQSLINRHTPILHYDSREDTWPQTVTWFVQHSELLLNSNEDSPVFTIQELAANPALVLEAHTRTGIPSSRTRTPGPTPQYHINVYNDFREPDGPLPVGMYARVTRIMRPITYLQRPTFDRLSPGDILVQYWQFFPHNDSQAPFNLGDHEGDWLYLDVYLDKTTEAIKLIVYHHHGDSNCAISYLPDEGPIPGDGIPHCYLEEGSHEWWHAPNISDCFVSDPHNGLGPAIRPTNVMNLGERFAPMPGLEPALIMYFTGKWGWYNDGSDPPAFQRPPAFHGWPDTPLMVAHVRAGASAGPDDGLGSASWPFASFQDAATRVSQSVAAVGGSGSVILQPGNYPGAITISRAMSLTAPSGPVTIGQ